MPTPNKQTPKSRPKIGIMQKVVPLAFEDEGIKINFYGKSGTGKTTLTGTFPKPMLAVIASGAGELRSLDTPENRKSIQQLVLSSSQEIRDIVEYLKENPNEYKTVFLDHATGLQELIMKEVLGLEELPAQLAWGIATQQQYGQVSLKMKELMRSLLSLKCNVVIIAQERDFNTDSESSDILQPYVASALSPSVVGWLNPAVDYVCQTFIREGTIEKSSTVAGKTIKTKMKTGEIEYCLRTYPSPTYASKFRIPKGAELPECIVDPTYDKIMKLLRGESLED